MKMYFKGGQGITEPVDINGNRVQVGDILTKDYGDNDKYNIKTKLGDDTEPFYEVKYNDKGFYYAESIKPYPTLLNPDARFYLHDFRFKYCIKL